MNKEINKIIYLIFFFILFIYLIFSILFFYFNKFFPPPFFYNRFDSLMDLYNPLWWSNNGGFYEQWKSFYSPFNLYLAQLLVSEDCKGVISSIDLRECSIFSAIFFSSICFLINSSLLFAIVRKRKDLYLWVPLLMLSFPMLYAIERGNFIQMALMFASIYVLSSRKFFQAIALLFMANIKYYLIILYGAYFLRHKFIHALNLVFIFIVFNFIFFKILGEGSFTQIVNNLLLFNKTGSILDEIVTTTSIKPVFQYYNFELFNNKNLELVNLISNLVFLGVILRFWIFLSLSVNLKFDEKFISYLLLLLLFILTQKPAYYSLILLYPFILYNLVQGYMSYFNKILTLILLLPFNIPVSSFTFYGHVNSAVSFDNKSYEIYYIYLQSLIVPLILVSIFYESTKKIILRNQNDGT